LFSGRERCPCLDKSLYVLLMGGGRKKRNKKIVRFAEENLCALSNELCISFGGNSLHFSLSNELCFLVARTLRL